VPALFAVGLSPAQVVATNKLAGTMGSFTSTFSFYRSGNLNVRAMAKYFPLAFVGSILGAWIVTFLSPELLKPIMLLLLAAVTVYTLVKKDWGKTARPDMRTLSPLRRTGLIALLFAIGFYDGFLGPGTGSFFIFTFLLLGFDFLRAAGNAKMLNFGSNIGALLLFVAFGEVHYAYGLIMGAAQIAGAVVGSQFAIRRGNRYIRKLFIAVTATLLLKNLYDYLHSLIF
jgi:hypothetical protein